MSIEVELKVGMIDMSLAQLLTKDHRIIEFPSILLPEDVVSGSIVKLSCERSKDAETKDSSTFSAVQSSILSKFSQSPAPPNLKVHNFTQTSVVLEWDPIDVGSAELLSLALYKNGQHLGVIPNPERRTSTKLSNLEIDKQYQFELALATSAGTFRSNLLDVHTLKMTDLSGLTVCVGNLEGSELSLQDIQGIVDHIGSRPLQQEVQLDTTHFICTEPDSDQYVRAQARNLPIVRPQWLRACEDERRLVEVRGYYLSEDPRLMAPHRPRAGSVATAATGDVSMVESEPPVSERSSQEPEQHHQHHQHEDPVPSITVTRPDSGEADVAPETSIPGTDSPEPAQETQEPEPVNDKPTEVESAVSEPEMTSEPASTQVTPETETAVEPPESAPAEPAEPAAPAEPAEPAEPSEPEPESVAAQPSPRLESTPEPSEASSQPQNDEQPPLEQLPVAQPAAKTKSKKSKKRNKK